MRRSVHVLKWEEVGVLLSLHVWGGQKVVYFCLKSVPKKNIKASLLMQTLAEWATSPLEHRLMDNIRLREKGRYRVQRNENKSFISIIMFDNGNWLEPKYFRKERNCAKCSSSRVCFDKGGHCYCCQNLHSTPRLDGFRICTQAGRGYGDFHHTSLMACVLIPSELMRNMST